MGMHHPHPVQDHEVTTGDPSPAVLITIKMFRNHLVQTPESFPPVLEVAECVERSEDSVANIISI